MTQPSTYHCLECGYATARWMGFCPQCRAQSSMVEGLRPVASAAVPVPIADLGEAGRPARAPSGMAEVDRVLGGGLVAGSIVLVGGEPGVGKSTLLLQMAAAMSSTGRVLYVTGEESAAQIGDRAERLGITGGGLEVLAETEVVPVERCVEMGGYRMVVVDSMQTMRVDDTAGTPGGVTQVREVGARLTALARRAGVPVVLVGHVTKDGSLAGPKVVEHLVDAVLYLEGDPDRGVRYLRGLKNRYGSVAQVGVFEMTGDGLVEVSDPSGLFVGDAIGLVPGTVVFPALCGRRTLLVEVQALVVPTGSPQPRRSVTGVPAGRVHQLLAVLHRHASLDCRSCDVFVSVVGGLVIDEPAADLAVALAIASSRLEKPLGPVGAMGEVGLAGEVRAVGGAADRRAELARFGFERMISGGGRRLVAEALLEAGLRPDRPRRLHSAGG
ncbi:MAG: DNA repair protein RadA [Acidimicrobiia bacterium]